MSDWHDIMAGDKVLCLEDDTGPNPIFGDKGDTATVISASRHEVWVLHDGSKKGVGSKRWVKLTPLRKVRELFRRALLNLRNKKQ